MKTSKTKKSLTIQERKARRRASQKRKGLCTAHGCNNPLDEGSISSCKFHRALNALYSRRHDYLQRLRGNKKACAEIRMTGARLIKKLKAGKMVDREVLRKIYEKHAPPGSKRNRLGIVLTETGVLARRAEYSRKYRVARKKSGKCLWHGCSKNAKRGKNHCEQHRLAHNQKHLFQYYSKKHQHNRKIHQYMEQFREAVNAGKLINFSAVKRRIVSMSKKRKKSSK